MSFDFNIPEGSKINIPALIANLKWTEEDECSIEELLELILNDDEILLT